MRAERDFLKIGFPNISINSNLSILQKMLTPCLQMQQKNLKTTIAGFTHMHILGSFVFSLQKIFVAER